MELTCSLEQKELVWVLYQGLSLSKRNRLQQDFAVGLGPEEGAQQVLRFLLGEVNSGLVRRHREAFALDEEVQRSLAAGGHDVRDRLGDDQGEGVPERLWVDDAAAMSGDGVEQCGLGDPRLVEEVDVGNPRINESECFRPRCPGQNQACVVRGNHAGLHVVERSVGHDVRSQTTVAEVVDQNSGSSPRVAGRRARQHAGAVLPVRFEFGEAVVQRRTDTPLDDDLVVEDAHAKDACLLGHVGSEVAGGEECRETVVKDEAVGSPEHVALHDASVEEIVEEGSGKQRGLPSVPAIGSGCLRGNAQGVGQNGGQMHGVGRQVGAVST